MLYHYCCIAWCIEVLHLTFTLCLVLEPIDSHLLYAWLHMQSNGPCTQCFILQQATHCLAYFSLLLGKIADPMNHKHEKTDNPQKGFSKYNYNDQRKKCDVEWSLNKSCWVLILFINVKPCLFRINNSIASHLGIVCHGLMWLLISQVLTWAVKYRVDVSH